MSDRFLHQRIDDEELWVDLEAGRFYGINETGVAVLEVWREGVHDVEAIADRLALAYEAPAAVIRPAVEGFLADARRRGLIES